MRRWVLRSVAVAIGLVVAAVAFVLATGTRQGALPDTAPAIM